MKLNFTTPPNNLAPVQDGIGFLARFFHSSRIEVMATMERYATGPDDMIAFINQYTKASQEGKCAWRNWVQSKRQHHLWNYMSS